MIVVPVLITSCQVSENPKSGPVITHIRITVTARIKASGFPVARVITFENLLKNKESPDFFFDV